MRGKIGYCHVLHMANEADVGLEAGLRDLGVQRLHVAVAALGIAREHYDGIIELSSRLQPRGGVDKHALALPACQPCCLQHDARATVHAPARSQGSNALGAN